MLNDAVDKLSADFEVPTHKSISNWNKLPILAILAILIFLIFARTGESIHGQISKLGEYLWEDYFSLRHEVTLPSCDRNLDVDKKLQELQYAASQKGSTAADDLFGDEFDPAATRASLLSQKESCLEQFAKYDHYNAHLTTGVIILRTVEEKFSQASVFATAQQKLFLVLLLFIAAAVASHNRHHISFRPMLSALDHRVSTGLQLLANGSLAASAWAFRSNAIGSNIEIASPIFVNLLVTGSTVLALISLHQMISLPKDARSGGKLFRAFLSVPLYTYVMLAFAFITFFVQGHLASLSLYFSAFFDNAGTYLDVALYLWCGMLLKQTQLGERVFSVFTPWKLPPELLATLAIFIMAVPTAYSGASSIIILAAGVVVYRELRKVGTRRQLALAVTAMSGSSGVVLKPCLIVIIISMLNKQVTSDILFYWGGKVFLLTATIFFCYALLIKKEPLKLVSSAEALQPSINNLKTLIPYFVVFLIVAGAYSIFIDAHLDQFSAPIILPVILFWVIVYERTLAKAKPIYDDPERMASVGSALTKSMSDAGVHVGALLFMMATFIIMTSLGGKVVSATFLNDIPGTWATMLCLTVMFVMVGMFMESIAAVGLISLAVAPVAYAKGIDPTHFWMTCLVALELGYLTPPMQLSHIFTRQVVGEIECGIASHEGDSFFYRHERLLLPILVMTTTLFIVAFGPMYFLYK